MAQVDQEALNTINPFSGPIPGQSLTNDPNEKNPWDNPPKYTGIKEATQTIFLDLLQEENLRAVVKLMAGGTPISDIAQMLLVVGYSKGQFNPDLMLLLIEPIMYMLLAIAEKVGVTNFKLYRGEADDIELSTEDEKELVENAQDVMTSFSDLPPREISPNAIPTEISEQLETLDTGQFQSLLERPEPTEADNSLLERNE